VKPQPFDQNLLFSIWIFRGCFHSVSN